MERLFQYRAGVVLLRVKLSHLGMCAATAIGIGMLIWFANFVSRRAESRSEGDGTVVRAEALTIYAPQSLIDLCRTRDISTIRTDEELTRRIADAGIGKIWCGSTVRVFLRDGRIEEHSYVGSPGAAAPHINFLLPIMLTLAGKPPLSPTVDYSRAAIRVVPERLEEEDPFKALDEMMRMP